MLHHFRYLKQRSWFTAVAVACLSPLPAGAQDAGADGGRAEAVVEEVVVTGSRIRRSNIDSPVPIMSLGQEDLRYSGNLEVSRIIRELPNVFEGTSTENSQSSTQVSGSASVELRNLGEDRTLVLIDGRRTVSNASNANVVSLDTIPSGFIERIEVITGGASAVYGSDAVSGVINIITRDRFEGLELEFRGGTSEHGGGSEHSVELTAGSNFDAGRGNLMFNYTYDRGEPIRGRDRSWATTPLNIDGQINLNGSIPGGRFLGNSWFYHPDTNELQQGFSSSQFGYNDRPDFMMRIEKERNLFAGKLSYDLTDAVTAILHTQHAHVWTNSQRAPDTASSSALSTPIPLDNPFIPDEILQQAIEDGEEGISFARRWTEIGPRSRGGDRDTTRTWLTLEGSINDWAWQAFYGFHRFRQAQNRVGDLVVPNFRDAVNVEPDPDNPGAYRCVDPRARDGGCVPINVFGIGAVSEEAIRWVLLQDALRATNEEKNAGAYITGDLLDLPAGPLSIAAGLEYRDISTESRWDSISTAGLSTVTQQANQNGSFDVSEAYVEAIIPIVGTLELEGAFRAAKYNQPTVDNTSSWKFGASWQPLESLRLRAMLATAERAPNTIELFATRIGNQGPLIDPCDGVSAASTGTIADNCRSEPSVAANIAQNGSFTRDTSVQIQAPRSGNLRLREETADTFTAGFVFTPPFMDGLSLTVDYYDIDIDDAINNLEEQDILFLCYGASDFPNNDFCPQITRDDATGEIALIDRVVMNVNSLRAKGLDTTVTYFFDLESVPGDFDFRLSHSYIDTLEQEFDGPDGVELQVFAGDVENPRHRARGTLGWNYNDLAVRWKAQFWSKARDGAILSDGSELRIGSQWKHDLYASYQLPFNQESSVYLGINNLFDSDPPMLYSGSRFGNDANTNSTYDIVGRFWYVGFNTQF